MGGTAWVTLATNDSYSLGALVLAHSLKKVGTVHQLAVLITPAVSAAMKDQLAAVFDVVKVVDVLDSKDEANLALLKRPELGITFTKLHCWQLTQFEKGVFLDADTLVVRNCDELFEREEFSAAPDVGWPDCFNSGVFVFRPSEATFTNLIQFALDTGSFDGGDQGLLNQFFNAWATDDIKKHLPFIYNLTSVAVYSYLPAFKQYGADTRIVHFIGPVKPWLQPVDPNTRQVTPTSDSSHLQPLLQHWWDIFIEKVHPKLSTDLECASGMFAAQSCWPSPLDMVLARCEPPPCNPEPPAAPTFPEPYTPYIEKDDERQYNLPYHPFQVVSSEGELLNITFSDFARDNDQEVQKAEIQVPEEKEPETEVPFASEEVVASEEVLVVEEKDEEPQSEPPPPNPFDFHRFVPDEECINAYLEKNVEEYRPYEVHVQDHHQHYENVQDHHHHYENIQEPVSHPPPQETYELPRFLTIAEDDPRQGHYVPARPPSPHRHEHNWQQHSHQHEAYSGDSWNENQIWHPPNEHPWVEEVHQPPPPSWQPEPISDCKPLQEEPPPVSRSKSMSNLSVDSSNPSPLEHLIQWKSQPEVNQEPTKKLPGLKPLVPKVKSPARVEAKPKYTEFTEVNMISQPSDPFGPPVDTVGFVERAIMKRVQSRKGMFDIPQGVLDPPEPPQVARPVVPTIPTFAYAMNEYVDFSECKRQAGNIDPDSEEKPPEQDGIRIFVPRPPHRRTKRSTRKVSEKSKKPPEDPLPSFDVDDILKRLSTFSIGYTATAPPDVTKNGMTQDKDDLKISPLAANDSSQEVISKTAKESPTERLFRGSELESYISKTTNQNGGDFINKPNSIEKELKKGSKSKEKSSRKGTSMMYENFGPVVGMEALPTNPPMGSQLERRASKINLDQPFAALPGESLSEWDNIPDIVIGTLIPPKLESTILHPRKLDETYIIKKPGIDERKPSLDATFDPNGSSKDISLTIKSSDISNEKDYLKPLPSDLSACTTGGSDQEQSPVEPSLPKQLERLNITSTPKPNGRCLDMTSENNISDQLDEYSPPSIVLNEPKEDDTKDCELTYKRPFSEETINSKPADLAVDYKNAFEKTGIAVNRSQISDTVSIELAEEAVEDLSIFKNISISETSMVESAQENGETKAGNGAENDEGGFLDKNSSLTIQEKGENLSEVEKTTDFPIDLKQMSEVEADHKTFSTDENQDLHYTRAIELLVDETNPSDTPEQIISKIITGNAENTFSQEVICQEINVEPMTVANFIATASTFKAPPEPTYADIAKLPKDSNAPPVQRDQPAFFFGPPSPEIGKKRRRKPTSGIRKPKKPLSPPEEPAATTSQAPTAKFVKRKAEKSEVQWPANRFDLLPPDAPEVLNRKKKVKKTTKKSSRPSTSVSFPPLPSSQSETIVVAEEDSQLYLPEPNDIPGIVGAIAQLKLEPGSEGADESSAQEEYLRRQSWETGRMDYRGRDSFANVWSKISETLSTSPVPETLATSSPLISPAESRPVSLAMILDPDSIDTLPADISDASPGEVADDDVIFDRTHEPSPPSVLPGILEEVEENEELLHTDDAAVVASEKNEGIYIGDEAEEKTEPTHEKRDGVIVSSEAPVSQDEELKEIVTSENPTVISACENPPKSDNFPEEVISSPPPTVEETIHAIKSESEIQPQEAPVATGSVVEDVNEKESENTVAGNQDKTEASEESVEVKGQMSFPINEPLPLRLLAESSMSSADVSNPSNVPETTQVTLVEVAEITKQTDEGSLEEKSKNADLEESNTVEEDNAVSSATSVSAIGSDQPSAFAIYKPNAKEDLPGTSTSPPQRQASIDEGKEKKGVFTKILEFVGVVKKKEEMASTAIFYDDPIEPDAPKCDVTVIPLKDEEPPTVIEEIKKDSTPVKDEEPPTVIEEIKKDSTPVKDEEPPTVIEEIKKDSTPIKDEEPPTVIDEIKVEETKKRSPSPRVRILDVPVTHIIEPTPPTSPEQPSMFKDPEALKVDETIAETPPVVEKKTSITVEPIPKISEQDIDRDRVKADIEEIISKAKLIAEDQLESDEPLYSNIEKSACTILAEPVTSIAPIALSEEFEEIKVTTEENRIKSKPSGSSKLSGQILKAIPPPRRRAISDARSASATRSEVEVEKPIEIVSIEEPVALDSSKSSSPSSPSLASASSSTSEVCQPPPPPPPVPPRRNRSRQRSEPQAPPKRKGKK